VQATRPLSILKNWTISSCLLRYTEMLTFSFRRLHCYSLEPNSSALLLGKSRSLMRSFNSSCLIRWNLLNWRSGVKSDVGGWGVFTNWYCASVTTQQTSLLTVWERSADTCIPSRVTILCIKPHFMYHDN
jgi:hypothetical protein